MALKLLGSLESSGGNVGIGTAAPDSKLHIEGSTDGTGSGADAILHVKQNGGWNANQPWALYVEGYTYLNGFRINAGDGIRALHKVTSGGQLGFSVTDTAPITFTQSNDTERMRVHTNGYVGIGTTSPVVKLQVDGTITSTGALTAYTSVPSINIGHNGDSAFIAATSGGGADTPISFSVGNNNEKMRITSTGNVGIGTTSPTYKLDVAGNIIARNSYPSIYVDHSGTVLGGIRADTTTKLEFKTLTTAPLSFQVNSSEKMRIENTGNVGIGTTSPTTKLHVTGVTQIAENGNSAFYGGNYVRVFNDQNFNIRNLSGTTVANISVSGNSYFNGGNVGIGTTAPIAKLDVQSTGLAANPTIQIVNTSSESFNHSINAFAPNLTNGENNVFIIGRAASTKNSGYIGYTYSAAGSNLNVLTFGHWGSDNLMNLTGDGKLGIGTTSPQVELHVKGTNGWGEIRVEGQTFASGHGASLEFYSGGTALADIYASTDKHLYFRTNGTTERMRITSAGNVGIGTTSPATKLDVNGVITATSGNSTNWNTAYGWGNHGSAGYLTTTSAASTYAPKASPALTGTPTAPTAAAATNTTQIATTAFVQTAVSNIVDSAPGALNTLNELAAALGDDASFSTTVTNSIATKLPLAGGTLTGAITGTKATFISDFTAGTNALNILGATNGLGTGITFSDNGTPAASNSGQNGYITYYHGDGNSYGSGNAFVLSSSETTMTILADGKLMYKEGIYSKPTSGTGAGTRKDANWDTAYADRNKWDGGSTGLNAATGRTSLGLGTLATLSTVNAATITDNSVGAAELNVTGNGSNGQVLTSDGDGTFSWTAKTTNTDTITSVGLSGSETAGTVTLTGAGATTLTQVGGTIEIRSTDTNTTYTVGDGGLTQNNFTTTLKNKLDGIATSANNYSLPAGTSLVRGGFKIGYTENGKNYPVEVSSEKMYVNVPWTDTNTDTITSVGVSGSETNGTITLTGAGATTITQSGGAIEIRSTDTNTTYSVGDGGLTQNNFTNTLKTKLDGIATSANNYSLPVAGTSIGGVKSGTDITVNASGDVSVNNDSHTHDGRYYTESEMQHFMARTLGWVSGYGNASEEFVNYNFTEDAIALSGVTDNSTGAIFKAIRVKSGDKVRFTIMLKGSAASTQGLYLRLYAYNGDLPDGKTHVSNSSSASEIVVVEDSSGDTSWEEDRAVPNVWTNYERTYTAGADGYVSLVVLNWTGHGQETIYIRQPDIQFEKVYDASNLGGTAASSYLTGIPSNSVGITQLNVSDGTTGQVLTTNGSGTLSFSTVTSGNNYSLPLATASIRGGVKIGYTASGKNYPVQLSSEKMYVNVPWTDTDTNTVTSVGILGDLSTGDIELRGGGSTAVTKSGGTITITSTDNNTTYSNATTSVAGLMSATDKTKLDGIAASANNYVHPTTTGNKHIPAGGAAGQFLKYSADGTAVWAADNNTTYSVGDNGLTEKNFTGTLKTKLDGIAASANNYVHPTTAGNKHIPTGGAAGQFLKYSADGTAVWAADNNTTYTIGDGGLTQNNFTTTLKNKLDGIAASANNYSLPEATSTARGGIELFSDTDQTVAANAVSSTAGRTYGIQLNSAGQAVVNVPWVDTNTNTTYTAGTGLTLSGTQFSVTANTYAAASHTHTPTQAGLGNLSSSGNSLAGNFTATGDITAYSDARVKENIETLPNALESVKQMRGVTYNKIGEEKQSIGVIAQELEEVVPQLVHTNEEGMKSVAYGNITALLIEALKEQQEQIEELKAQLDGLTK
jgi:hypothetical protein